MEKISKKINYLFENLFNDNINHLFYEDFEYVNKIEMNREKYYDGIIEVPKKKSEIKTLKFNDKINYKNLNYEHINQIKVNLNKMNNLDELNELVGKLLQYHIPDSFISIKNLNNKNLLEFYKKNEFNILIAGAGPAGLFLANYLYKYYINQNPNPININILILDNNISKKHYKKPYSRKRSFGFNTNYFSYIIPKIYCLTKSNKNIIHMPISTLEYMLYCNIYNNNNIKFWFDCFNYTNIKKIIKDGNFKVFFDCTGGRLEHNILKVSNTKWITDILIKESKLKNKIEELGLYIKFDKLNNIVKLTKKFDNSFIPNYYYSTIIIIKNNYVFDSISLKIRNIEDLKLFTKFNRFYLDYNNIINFSKNITDDNERKLFYNLLKKFKKEENLIFKIRIFQINMRHKIKISDTFKINKKKVLLIGVGDTIFHSHFIKGAGINRVFDFAAKCCNLIENIILDL